MKALTGNLGLKIVALVLAIALYYSLKPESSSSADTHDYRLFESR